MAKSSVKRKYVLKTRFDKAFANYKKRYRAMKKRLANKGYQMADDKGMLTKKEYRMTRRALVDMGVTTNINQKIVSQQAFEYGRDVAIRFKAFAEENELEWKNLKVMEIMKGSLPLSETNEWLKATTDKTGAERAAYISQMFFDSE